MPKRGPAYSYSSLAELEQHDRRVAVQHVHDVVAGLRRAHGLGVPVERDLLALLVAALEDEFEGANPYRDDSAE